MGRERSAEAAAKDRAAKLRICFVTSIHPDFDARVWNYGVMLAARGHQVRLVCPWNAPDGSVREGIALHTFPRARLRLARPFSIPLHLAHKLRPLLPTVDVVHFHDIDILPWMAVLSLFKPVVYDVHENYPDEMLVRQWIPGPLRRVLYHTVRGVQAGLSLVIRNVVFVVPEQQKDFPRRGLRSILVRNYATLQLLDAVKPGYCTRPSAVVFIASNYEANGTFLFLEIATRMLQRRPDLRFIMADRWADPVTRSRALQMIRGRGLHNVLVVPNVAPQNIVEHLNRGTIAISADLRLPQRINALPTKLFEYMAAGLPIIASDLPHACRLAEQTGAITLCQPENPDSFIRAIEWLDDNRELAFAMGQRGQRAFRERFCWETQAEELERFYAEVLDARRAARAGAATARPAEA